MRGVNFLLPFNYSDHSCYYMLHLFKFWPSSCFVDVGGYTLLCKPFNRV